MCTCSACALKKKAHKKIITIALRPFTQVVLCLSMLFCCPKLQTRSWLDNMQTIMTTGNNRFSLATIYISFWLAKPNVKNTNTIYEGCITMETYSFFFPFPSRSRSEASRIGDSLLSITFVLGCFIFPKTSRRIFLSEKHHYFHRYRPFVMH
jgi:hypothetical protein